MPLADGTILPNPAVPKTFGILNVIFAVLLILFGICGGVMYAALPTIQRETQQRAAQQREAEARERAAELKALDDRAAAATTDEAKATIARERAAVASRPASPTMPAGFDLANIPSDRATVVLVLINTIWGLILDIVLLVSGIALIRLRNWGRRACIVWAVLTIVSVLGLTIYGQVVNGEAARAAGEAQLAKIRATAQQPNATPAEQMAAQIAEMGVRYAFVFTLSYILASITYPILCLIFLNLPRARVACLAGSREALPLGLGQTDVPRSPSV